MRVALYHPWIYLRSGIERMLVEMVTRSRHDWTLFTHRYVPASTYPELAALDVRPLVPGVSVRRSTGPLSRAAWTIATTRLPDVGAAALLVSSEGLGDLVLTRNHLPAVAYCHTPLKILHDPVTRRHLAEIDPSKHALARALGPGFTAVDRRLWRRYAHAFANSAEVARRLRAAGLHPRGAVEILHPGVDTTRFSPAVGPGVRRGLLVAGRIMWQKQIEIAIDAYRRIVEAAGTGPASEPLTIAGAVDEKSRPYLAALRERATGLSVEFVVGPTDDDLVHRLRTARALVFTPPNEDFGMVVLEALACGTPVIAARAGGPVEILRPDTGRLVDHSVEGFAAPMAAALTDDVAPAVHAAAVARAREFGWDAFARRIDDVMDAVASGTDVGTGSP